MRSLIACSAVVLNVAFSTAKAQDLQRDILAGHITGPSGAVAGAMVSVTPVDATAGAAPLIARTDIEGRWLVAVQEGSGNYVVRVTAIGMKPAQTTCQRGEPRKPIIVDIHMEAAAVSLDAVRVTEARRPRPPRENGAPERVGPTARPTDSREPLPSAIRAILRRWRRRFLASRSCRRIRRPAGLFGARTLARSESHHVEWPVIRRGDIPRDALVMTRVASTSFDVSRGGFSGGQLS